MKQNVPNFLIAAARKSSGKTTVSLGLAKAFSRRGLKVQTFKKGPDYIDPLWLAQASYRACYNLDFNTQSEAEILATFRGHLHGSDLGIVETNKGLFDGVDLTGSDSNAQLAKILATPIILVIDTIGITRGIAPLLHGMSTFDPDIKISGVILNKTGGSRHEGKLRDAVEHYTDIPVLGAIGRDDELTIKERHLGLTTPGEKSGASKLIEHLADRMENSLDLEAIADIAAGAENVAHAPQPLSSTQADITIAVARDAAFGFYYADDLAAFENAGAKLRFFSPLTDEKLPPADGLFIGGGFPETHMKALEKNVSMRRSIHTAITNGLPAYAECGGLMYLARSIKWQGETAQMVGVINGDCRMNVKPQGRGFARLQPSADHPWNLGDISEFPAHEFHYASINNLPADTSYAYTVTRGHGIDGNSDGIVAHNLLANFCHLRNTASSPWVEWFVNYVRGCKAVAGG